jgi:hypothetical protein
MDCSLKKTPKLTPAQKREYEFLKLHGSCYVSGLQRRLVFYELLKKGLAQQDGSWYWFHINE